MSEQRIAQAHLTIIDNNDIESITVEYARNQSTSEAPTSGWSTTRPAWAQGYYIWQRTRIHKSGTQASADTFGTAVCLTGSTGQTGATGKGITGIETLYATNNSATTAPTSGWQSQPPTYDSSKPKYWVKVTTTYNSGDPTIVTYLDNGITDAMATAAAANQTANNAKSKADTVEGNLNTYISSNNANITALQSRLKKIWINENTSGTYLAGTYAASGIDGVTFSESNPSTYGYNTLLRQNMLALRYNTINMTALTTNALTFYIPTQSNGNWVQGEKGLELTSDALTFYNPSTNNAQLTIGANGALQSGNYLRGSDSKFSSNGTKIDLVNGDIITKYFRVSQGLESGLTAGAYIHGTIEALNGKIGAGSTNYWEIGEYTDYNLNTNATMIGHGGSFIQLGDSSTWRLATNRLHTGWYMTGNTTLNYPIIDSKYWDFGIHVPTSKTDKFLYIRSSKSNTSATNILQNLLYDIDDTYATAQWDYKFWIDGEGKVHAPGFYIGDSTTPIGGGAGTVAERLTQGYGSATQPIYFNSNGVPTNTTYTLNAAGAKGVDTSISAASTSTNLPTSQAVAAFVEGKGYITSYVDNKVQTSQANTTKIYLAGTSTAGTTTGTLNYDSNIYADTTAGALHATTFNGYTLAAASAKGVDTSLTTSSTSTNLPTSKAVVDLIKQYLPLTGGSITGPTNFGDSVSADELTVGNLIVNGAASFTNNLQANTINGVEVGNSPKFTDTTYTFANGTNGFTVTPLGGTAQTVTVTPSISNNITGTGTRTSGYLVKFSGTNTVTNGPALGTGTTKFLREDGTWVVPAGTGVTSVAASGSGGITISGSPITTSGTITIGLNLSTAINGLGEGSSNANRNDYIVAQYAGGGTTTTTYHRRKLSNIFAALNSSDITTALGYTPYDATNPDGYTTNTGTVTSVKVQGSNGLTGSGTVTTTGTITLSHSDTSSQASSSNSGRTYIQSVTLDGYGHVTGLSTATETVTDTHHTANLITGASATAKANAAATTNGSVYLNLVENDTVRNAHKIVGSGTTTVTSDADGVITISSADSKTGTVTSITLTQGTGISIGSSGTAITTSGTRTIALADNYGDTKNPYASKTARYVLAAPANAAGAPSFRALTGADVGLGSVLNATQVTGIGQGADGKIRVYKGDSNYEDVAVEIVATESSSVASAQKLTSYGGSTKQPVYFPNSGTNAGKPVAIGYTIETSVPSGAVFTDTTYTFTSGTNGFTVTPLNGNAQTVTVTPSITNNVTGSGTSGYLAKFNGANTITNGPALGTDATKFLNNKGEWVVPGGTYSLPLAANGTRGGVQIGYTQSGKNYPVQLSSEKMYVNVPWENTTYSAGTGLSLSGTTFNHSNSVTAGTAGTSSATSSTDRTVSVPYVTYDAQGHITGSGTHTHTIDTYPEAYLTWGGKDFSASYGPIDAAMIDVLGANRFAFLKAAGLTIEYSTDGGSSWSDYGATDAQKVGLFSNGYSFYLGKHTTAGSCTTNDQLRVTIATSAAHIYTVLNKIAIYMSTSGSTVQVLIEKALESTPTTFVTHKDWTGISGWSGWNILNISGLTTYGNTAASQYGRIRFTFKSTVVNTNYSAANISKIMGFGGVGWSTPSNMAATGHLYSFDSSQNATFPAQVTATQFNGPLNGNATSATKATNDVDGNPIKTTYAKLSGATFTGAINTANGTYNKIGDDVQIGDINVAGTLGIKGINGRTGIRLVAYSGSTNTDIYNDGAGTLTITGTVASTFSGNLTGNVTGTASGNVTSVQYDSTNTKFTYTKNGTNTDIATIANLKTYLGLGAAAYKGIDTSMPSTATDNNVPTTKLMKSFVEGKGYVTSSGVTSVATSSPITGGTITGTGTIGHATSGVGTATTAAGFYKFKYDTYGHVTGVTAVAKADITGLGIPGSDTDTKNTAGSTDTNSALFLVGATSQAANPQTYSHDTVKINSTGQIISTGYEMTTSSSMSNAKCQMKYDDSLQAIVFSFA